MVNGPRLCLVACVVVGYQIATSIFSLAAVSSAMRCMPADIGAAAAIAVKVNAAVQAIRARKRVFSFKILFR